jgi:hypothetical protein
MVNFFLDTGPVFSGLYIFPSLAADRKQRVKGARKWEHTTEKEFIA